MIIIERPEGFPWHSNGLPWLVAYDPETRVIAYAPAPPHWATPELAAAASAALRAAVAGRCLACSAARSEAPASGPAVRMYLVHWRASHNPPVGDVGSPSSRTSITQVPHPAWCPSSPDAVLRLELACRPAGERWAADMDGEVIARLNEYVSDLATRLAPPEP